MSPPCHHHVTTMSPPVGAQEQEQLLCIIMEYAEGGTLGDVI